MKTSNSFIKVPFVLSKRTDITPSAKLILGYIYTRSNVPKGDWTISLLDVSQATGIPQQTVSHILKPLIKNNILRFIQFRKPAIGRPYKIYGIDQQNLINHIGLSPIVGVSKTDFHPKDGGTFTNGGWVQEYRTTRREEVQEEAQEPEPVSLSNLVESNSKKTQRPSGQGSCARNNYNTSAGHDQVTDLMNIIDNSVQVTDIISQDSDRPETKYEKTRRMVAAGRAYTNKLTRK